MTMTTDKSHRAQLVGVREVRSRPFDGCELRETPNGTGGIGLTFTGYASVTGRGYTVYDGLGEWEETIDPRAFDRTLSESPDVRLTVDHMGLPLARTKANTMRLSVDGTGLYTEAVLDPSRPDVQVVASALRTGAVDAMSFAFRAPKSVWSDGAGGEGWSHRTITEINLHGGDTAIVSQPANPFTAGTIDLRSLMRLAKTDPELRSVLEQLEASRSGRVNTTAGYDEARMQIYVNKAIRSWAKSYRADHGHDPAPVLVEIRRLRLSGRGQAARRLAQTHILSLKGRAR